MDKIWDRKSSMSEFIGRCGGDEKIEWPRRTDKSRTLNLFLKIHNFLSLLYVKGYNLHSDKIFYEKVLLSKCWQVLCQLWYVSWILIETEFYIYQ